MKQLILPLVLSAVVGSGEANESMPIELKVATIDAGKYVSPTDMSVPRAKLLLAGVASCYRVSQVEAADMASVVRRSAIESGGSVGLLDALDYALLACDSASDKKTLANHLAYYAGARKGGQSHHQASRGLIILSYVAKASAKKK